LSFWILSEMKKDSNRRGLGNGSSPPFPGDGIGRGGNPFQRGASATIRIPLASA